MWSSWPWVRTMPRTQLLVFNEVGDVGDDDVDAEQLRLGEHEAGVNDDNVVFPANGEAVHAELAQPAKGNNFQLF